LGSAALEHEPGVTPATSHSRPVPAAAAAPTSASGSATDWHHQHASEHVGAVWVRITADPVNAGFAHRVVLRWGADLRLLELPALGPSPISLVHRKTAADRGVLLVEVQPAAIVAFGEGPPPVAPAVDVADGWIRSASVWDDELELAAAAATGAPRPAVGRVQAPAAAADPQPEAIQYHVRLHRLMGNAEAFNLSRGEVIERFVLPWRSGHSVTLGGRVWSPERTRLAIYAGPPLTTNQRALEQGWVHAMRTGEDVTDALLAQR
jgi:hypothetical protein